MPRSGPILLIDDDTDDQELLESALRELGLKNPVVAFDNTKDAFDYLLVSEQPFVIFCDINMPAENGITFKHRIDAHPALRQKSIPFLFISTNPSREVVNKAYSELTIQGVFRKSDTFGELKNMLRCILEYWTHCHHPNDYRGQ